MTKISVRFENHSR